MSNHLKAYGESEGPLGIPMRDNQARMLDGLLKTLPEVDRKLRRFVTAKAPAELLDGERADVSWITTESIDRDKEIVIAKGMNDSQFAANPLVTLNHCYYKPPVARSLWRKRAKDGDLVGIKAKTQYPTRPTDWTEDCWPPDTAFSLVKSGLMNGKSIGFIVLKSHSPTSHEIAAKPDLFANVRCVIDEWLLLEYACCFLPTNQDAIVEAVSKSNIKLPHHWLPEKVELPRPTNLVDFASLPFVSYDTIEHAVERAIQGINTNTLIETATKQAIAKLRGAV
jgi:hypothetical protein